MRFQACELFFVPNLLTYLRIVLIPLIFYYLEEQNFLFAAVLGGGAMVSDILDGILARKINQNSELGKILDPLTDKIAIGAFAVYVVLTADFPLWAAVLIIGRDVLIILLGLIFSGKTKEIPTSNFLGKITALSWAILLVIYVVRWEAGEIPFLILSVILLAASIISYGARLIRLIRST